jgi:hypothetical protein
VGVGRKGTMGKSHGMARQGAVIKVPAEQECSVVCNVVCLVLGLCLLFL